MNRTEMNLPLSWQALDCSPGPRSPTQPCLQQPAPRRASWNRQGCVGIHVTRAVPSARRPHLGQRPKSAAAAALTRVNKRGFWGGQPAATASPSRPPPRRPQRPARPPSAKAVARRLSDSAQPRTPDVPRPGLASQKRGRGHASGGSATVPARWRFWARPVRRCAQLEAPQSSPLWGASQEMATTERAGIAHAQKYTHDPLWSCASAKPVL